MIKDNYSMYGRPNEGTIELKYDKRREPNLKTLLRGTQQSALLDYFESGGRRRFALCYCNGIVFLWNTVDFRRAILGEQYSWTMERRWCVRDEKPYDMMYWLCDFLSRNEDDT